MTEVHQDFRPRLAILFSEYLSRFTLENLAKVHLDRYPFLTNPTFLDFEFESDGPNGKIKKVVRYSPQDVDGMTYFNLGFGDRAESTGKIDDVVVSNNHDRDKVLATVAATVVVFTKHFPDIFVYVQGSNQARTRLYQMGISANWQEIEIILDVMGFVTTNGNLYKRCEL